MGKPNLADQKLQSVLYIMGVPLGKHGIDGERGPDTAAAVRMGAKQIGAHGSTEDMRQTIVDKLNDPKFRNVALEKLKEMPQNKETFIAIQTILAAAKHDTFHMTDHTPGRIGMMNGNMNEATKRALENTKDGERTAGAFTALGIPDSATQLAMNGGGGKLNDAFQMANSGVTPTTSPSPQQPVLQPAVRVAALDQKL